MADVVTCSPLRTPAGSKGGALASVTAQLASQSLCAIARQHRNLCNGDVDEPIAWVSPSGSRISLGRFLDVTKAQMSAYRCVRNPHWLKTRFVLEDKSVTGGQGVLAAFAPASRF